MLAMWFSEVNRLNKADTLPHAQEDRGAGAGARWAELCRAWASSPAVALTAPLQQAQSRCPV